MHRVYRGQSVAVTSRVVSNVATFCSLQNGPHLGGMRACEGTCPDSALGWVPFQEDHGPALPLGCASPSSGLSPQRAQPAGSSDVNYGGVQTPAGVTTPSPENGSSWGTSSSQYPYLAASSRSIAAMSGVLC